MLQCHLANGVGRPQLRLIAGRSLQEARLSPRDRAMSLVGWNLASCHATVQKLLVRQVLNKSKLWSWRVKVGRCVINMCTQPWRVRVFHCLIGVINKPTTLSCVYRLYTDDLLWRNFLSPQCRNCSRDPDHAHLGSTDSPQDKTSHGRPVYKIWSL